MKINIASTLLLLASFVFWGCTEKTDEDIISEDLNAYATAYFNWDFPSANNNASADATKWLEFLSSQLTERDMSAIKTKDELAYVEIENININTNENTAKATIIVTNFLCMDSIGKTPQCCNEAKFEVNAKKKKETWKFDRPQRIK